MRYGEFLVDYIAWHYGRSIQDFLNVWGNYVWFFYNFFSISILSKTLFSPWRRMDEHGKSGFHPEVFFEKLVTNFVIRIVGVVLRLFMIVSGLVAILLTFLIGFAAFLVWLALPLSVVAFLIASVVVLIA